MLAAAVFLAIFGDRIAAPGEAGFPLAIVLVVAYLPFLVAAALEFAAGRSSPSFGEVVTVTLASGAGLGILLVAGIGLVERLATKLRPRS